VLLLCAFFSVLWLLWCCGAAVIKQGAVLLLCVFLCWLLCCCTAAGLVLLVLQHFVHVGKPIPTKSRTFCIRNPNDQESIKL
jgi:hypothetical protein